MEYGWTDANLTLAHGYLLPAVRARLHAASDITSVVDLGCGNGAMTAALADEFEMTGLDRANDGLTFAKQHRNMARFIERDLADDMSDLGTFDAAISVEVIEHLYDPFALLRAAHTLLRPGGTLVLTTPYHGYIKNLALAAAGHFDRHWHPLRVGGHIKFFSRATLSQALDQAGFVDLRFAGAGRLPFLWKSMVFTARKPE